MTFIHNVKCGLTVFERLAIMADIKIENEKLTGKNHKQYLNAGGYTDFELFKKSYEVLFKSVAEIDFLGYWL